MKRQTPGYDLAIAGKRRVERALLGSHPMLARCAVLVTLMGLTACSGATNTGFFDENGTEPTDGGKKTLGPKIKKDGGADGGDDEAGATTDGGTTAKDAPAPTCGLANLKLSKNACDACAADACCTQWKACDKNAECVALLKCAVECGNDQDCVQTCVFLHEEGRNDVVVVNECQKKNCATQCK